MGVTATITIEPTTTPTPKPTSTPTITPLPTSDYFAELFPNSDIEYAIPLAVRHVTEKQATFSFELHHPTDGILVYREIHSGSQREVKFSSETTQHMITVGELTPRSEYEALVLLGNNSNGFKRPLFAGNIWNPIRFRPSQEWPLRIAVLGDASFGDEATMQLVDLIEGQNIDFVIHTGDVVYETDSTNPLFSYVSKFFIPFSSLLHLGPVYTVLGNHDYDSSLQKNGVPFYDYAFPPFPNPDIPIPGERRGNQFYAFSYRDIQFLMLDTHVFAGGNGRAVQDTWISERLNDPRFRITIPVFHVAPYSSSIVHPDDGLPIRYSWNWRFEEANVPLVLSGHFHHYERLEDKGITYIVSGGGSSTLYAQGETLPESKIYARKTHFVILEFYDEYINLTALTLNGKVIDTSTIGLE